MAPTVLTDAERNLRPHAIRRDFRYWLDFQTSLGGVYRRWFASLEARNQYVVNLPKTATIAQIGEER
jgi:hypothetical protein